MASDKPVRTWNVTHHIMQGGFSTGISQGGCYACHIGLSISHVFRARLFLDTAKPDVFP